MSRHLGAKHAEKLLDVEPTRTLTQTTLTNTLGLQTPTTATEVMVIIFLYN